MLARAARVLFVTNLLRAMCHYDCGDEVFDGQPVKNLVAERLLEPFVKMEKLLPRVEAWARARYEAMIKELIADVKAVAFSNAVLFLLAALATRRSSASRTSAAPRRLPCERETG
jgi:hypothetical protein